MHDHLWLPPNPGIAAQQDADLDLAAKNIVKGGYSYSGQRCTAVKLVLAHETIADKLVEKVGSPGGWLLMLIESSSFIVDPYRHHLPESLLGYSCDTVLIERRQLHVITVLMQVNAGIAKLTVGRPEDDAAIVPVVSESSAKFVEGLVMDAKEKGATLCQEYKREVQLGLMRVDVCQASDAWSTFSKQSVVRRPVAALQGNLIWPLLLDHVNTGMRIAWEEPFGPVIPVVSQCHR